jgi:hypothetical protein
MGVVCLLASAAFAQRFDIAVGAGTVISKSSTGDLAATPPTFAQTLGGGTYLNFYGALMIKKHLGFGGEVAWRAKQNLYGGYQPFRPIFFDFDGIYSPNFGKHAGVDLMAGIGAQTARFYTPTVTCSFTCTNYISQTRFLGHFGGGVRLYAKGNFFVRPEAHIYLVHNNELTSSGGKLPFSSNFVSRVGMSIGYSFRGEQP